MFSYTSIYFLKSSFFRWIKKGSFAVLDQGLFSGANFLVSILLARWIPPKEYGAFVVAMSVYYFLMGFHTAIITEPMMVFGASKYRGQFRRYLKVLLYAHIVLVGLISVILFLTSFAMSKLGQTYLSNALLGLSIASPFLLLLWLVRRACYVQLKPQMAGLGSFSNLILLLFILYHLYKLNLLSPFSGLLTLGISSLLSSFILILFLYKGHFLNAKINLAASKDIINEHMRYGKWAIGTAFVMWIPGNIYYVLLPMIVGLEGSAALRALQNLLLPLQQAISAVSMLLLPTFAKFAENMQELNKRMVFALSAFVMISVVYWLILSLNRIAIISFLYKGKYLENANILVLFGILSISVSAVSIFGAGLRALKRPNKVFFAYIASLLSSLMIGIPLLFKFHITGAVIGQILSSLTTAVVMMWFYGKIINFNKEGR